MFKQAACIPDMHCLFDSKFSAMCNPCNLRYFMLDCQLLHFEGKNLKYYLPFYPPYLIMYSESAQSFI